MNLRKSILFLANLTVAKWTTKNGSIYYNETIPYIVRGVNWHGMETNCKVPHGLWLNPMTFYMSVLSENDFNSIRLPLSYEIMNNLNQSVTTSCVSATPELNNESVGKFLEVFIDNLKSYNLTLLVDLHNIEGRITEYPWTSNISGDQIIDAWINFLSRYGKDLFGIELKNEPHNECTLDEFIDWCIKAIKRIEIETQFRGIYFISGVQYSFKDDDFEKHWDGVKGDNQGVHFPNINYRDLSESKLLNANIPLNRIAFSPHIYAPDVLDYISEIDWEFQFGFISEKNWCLNKNPIIFTELGGRLEGSDEQFYEKFYKWINKKNFTSGMYWYTLPPTSSSTGGLMVGNMWNAMDRRKLDYIENFITNPTVNLI